VDENGERVQSKNIIKTLTTIVQNKSVGLEEKLRLLMIYLISQGAMNEPTRKALMGDTINIELQKAIRNLEKIGVDISPAGTRRMALREARFAEFQDRAKKADLSLMRYSPFLEVILKKLLNNNLSIEEYPYISPPPPSSSTSLKQKKNFSSNATKGKKSISTEIKIEDTRTRYLVFMLGGVTFSEIRCTYEIATETKANIFIGSSHTMTAIQFIRGLANVDIDTDLATIGNESQSKTRPSNTKDRDKDGKDEDNDLSRERARERQDQIKKTDAEFRKTKFF